MSHGEHACEFRFYAELNDFVRPRQDGLAFQYRFGGTPAVKDAIEALGVPHTEVDLILVNGTSVAFGHRLRDGDRVAVYPVFESMDIAGLTRLRPSPLRDPCFICDVHLGKLSRRLRLLGFDVAYSNTADDAGIVAQALGERRIILTQDRGILKMRVVEHGYLVRSDKVMVQVQEVLDRFDLCGLARPFSRCVRCNALLEAVAKRDVEHALPPRTRQHYQNFHRCSGCGALYWRGAHTVALEAWLSRISCLPASHPGRLKPSCGEKEDLR